MKNFLKKGFLTLAAFGLFIGSVHAAFNYAVAPDGTEPQVNEGRMSIVDFNAQEPTVANVTMTSANTEYSYTIPNQTTKLFFKLRGTAATAKLTWTESGSGTTYLTIPAGGTFVLDNVFFVGKTLYFQSATASQVAEIIVFN